MATLPGDVEEQETVGALAEQDQTDAAFRDITENSDQTTPEPTGKGKSQLKGRASKKSLKRNLLIGGGVGGGVIGIAIILFFLLLFKNIHIKNLFLDYEFAKFNRAFRNRLEQSVKEANANGEGTAESTVQPGDSPEQALGEVDAAQVKQMQEDLKSDPQAFNDVADNVASLDEDASVSGSTASEVNPEFKIDASIASEDGKTDTEAKTDTDKAIKEQINQEESGQSPPNDAVKDAVDDTSKALDSGASADAAATSAGEGFARGLNSFISKASGPFLFATIGCIARDIFVSGYKAVAQSKLSGLANSAATTNKYADCQKQGKCSLAQIGAVANRFDGTVDGKPVSFTESCGAVRASGKIAQPGVNCTDLDTNMRPVPGLANGLSGQIQSMLKIADSVNSALSLGPIKLTCGVILNPITQITAAVVNVGAAVVGVVTDVADFGATSVVQAAATGAGIVFASKAGKALAIDAALHYGNLLFKQNFNPIQMGNMQAAGDKALATDACVRNGCRQLSQSENTQLALEIHADNAREVHNKGLAYQLFSPENPTSTLGMLAVRIPTSPRTAMASVGQFIATTLNPQRLGKSLFALINPVTPAWAADTEYGTYGIPDYGYTDAELDQWKVIDNSRWVKANISDADQAKFEKCLDPTQTKLSDLLTGDGNGSSCNSYNDSTNPNYTAFQHYRIYKLDQRVTHDLVLLYNNQGGTGSSTTSATPGTVTPPPGDAAQLAQELLDNAFVLKVGRLVPEDLQSAAAGRPGSSGKAISSVILQALATLAINHSYRITALESGGTGHAPNSLHYSGDAVDIDQLDNQAVLGRNAPAITIINLLAPILPSGSRFGQSGCGPTPTLPAGISTFDDTCNHLHIDVPAGTP